MPLSPTSSRGGGNGPQPVAVVLQCTGLALAELNLHVLPQHNIKWTAAYDNVYDFNSITTIPEGLGITIPLDGSSANMATTEAGIWSFELSATLATDPTLFGALGFNYALQKPTFGPPTIANAAGGAWIAQTTLALPAGATGLRFSIAALTVATADPYIPDTVYAVVTRIS